jgi:hypothetical protein
MRSIKSAKLGTYLDVSSFETPFSYYGRMSNANVRVFYEISKTYVLPSVLPFLYTKRKKRTKSLK